MSYDDIDEYGTAIDNYKKGFADHISQKLGVREYMNSDEFCRDIRVMTKMWLSYLGVFIDKWSEGYLSVEEYGKSGIVIKFENDMELSLLVRPRFHIEKVSSAYGMSLLVQPMGKVVLADELLLLRNGRFYYDKDLGYERRDINLVLWVDDIIGEIDRLERWFIK